MDFKERVRKIRELGVAYSSDLYAGCPMIFSCDVCGGIAETRPESYDPRNYGKPGRTCKACTQDLKTCTLSELGAIVKEVDKEIPYKRAELRGERASWDWLFEMGRLSCSAG